MREIENRRNLWCVSLGLFLGISGAVKIGVICDVNDTFPKTRYVTPLSVFS